VTARPRVYVEGVSTFVIGTDDVQVAIGLAGITPETHRWAGTGYGLYARRQGRWRYVSNYLRPPKDARPGVAFYGPITERGSR
jgi:hypothetical protein